ncbi:MAG: sulfur relay protein DsrC [Pseudomonadota bacterium]
MLHVSNLLLQHKEVDTFEQFVEVVKQNAKSELFFRMDLKPPFPDTPDNWEMVLEAAFSSANSAHPD